MRALLHTGKQHQLAVVAPQMPLKRHPYDYI